MLELIAAAAIQLPQGNLSTARALARRLPEIVAGESTVAQVRLVVAPDGRVKECTVERAIGKKPIAQELCRGIVGVKYKPARDERSEKAYALFFTLISAFPDGEEALRGPLASRLTEKPMPADLTVTLKSMPNSLRDRPRVVVKTRISARGQIEFCQPFSADRKAISKVACDQARSQSFETLKTQEGEAVEYVRRLTVQFVTEG